MSSLGGERKIATMVFADLVGSTELAAGPWFSNDGPLAPGAPEERERFAE